MTWREALSPTTPRASVSALTLSWVSPGTSFLSPKVSLQWKSMRKLRRLRWVGWGRESPPRGSCSQHGLPEHTHLCPTYGQFILDTSSVALPPSSCVTSCQFPTQAGITVARTQAGTLGHPKKSQLNSCVSLGMSVWGRFFNIQKSSSPVLVI